MAKLKRTWRVVVFAVTTLVLMASFLTLGMFVLAPAGVDAEVNLDLIESTCERVGSHEGPDFKTMVVGASVVTTLAPEDVWKTLVDLERWGDWCPMTRGQPKWVEGFRWIPGAMFFHEVELGFPLGSASTLAFVERVSPNRLLTWVEQRRGATVCRTWQIDPLPDGGSRITCIEAARSLSTAAIRPFTVGPLQRSFREAVNRLVAKIEKQRSTAGQ